MNETKIQVDRKRLEAMITGESPGETAEAFFARVERQTATRVCWPSRLKIQAKTKKDPFVKLIGSTEAVQKAAEMIGNRLRVKRDKVTLKMEISHCLHSQIIGRGGRNTQKIMRDTGCHIHFPDSNKCLTNPVAMPQQAKNDQVSISGCAKDVEKAREMLRSIGPLAVSMTIQLSLSRSNFGTIQQRLDPAKLQRHFPQNANATNGGGEVSVQFSPCPPDGGGHPLLGSLHFLMRSSSRNELDMLREFGRLCQLIGVFPSGAELFCCSQFEIRPSALPSLSAVRWIAFRTNTQIQLNGQGFLISGPLEGIFVARKFLTGLLPVSLHFEKPPAEGILSNAALRAMERELDLQIGEKKRRKMAGKGGHQNAGGGGGGNDSMAEREYTISTYEANLFNAYLARNRLLQLNEPSSPTAPTSTEVSAERISSSIKVADDEEEQFPQDNDQAALMRSLCRESLLADQLAPALLPFPICKTPPLANSWAANDGTTIVGTTIVDGKMGEDLANEGGPKLPDPEESPIAAGLLAGAKSANLENGSEFRRTLDRERGMMLLKGTQAIYNSPLLEMDGTAKVGGIVEGATKAGRDFWPGYHFSSSLPTELLSRIEANKLLLDGGGRGGGGGFWERGGRGERPRGRPIVGRGEEDEEERMEEEANGHGNGRENGEEKMINTSIAHVPHMDEHLMNVVDPQQQQNGGIIRRNSSSGRKATALVHPRVAALQAGEQQKNKPKFTMSTGSGLHYAAAGVGNGIFGPQQMAKIASGQIGDLAALVECSKALATTGTPAELAPSPPPPSPAAPPQWDIRLMNEPSGVLAQLGLAEHAGLFREQEIDMQAFLLLDEQCLGSLGVNTVGARRKIMHAVQKLRESARRHGLYSL